MLPPADTHIKMQIVRRKVTWHVCGGGDNPREFSKNGGKQGVTHRVRGRNVLINRTINYSIYIKSHKLHILYQSHDLTNS
jgi:hypothetical protein